MFGFGSNPPSPREEQICIEVQSANSSTWVSAGVYQNHPWAIADGLKRALSNFSWAVKARAVGQDSGRLYDMTMR